MICTVLLALLPAADVELAEETVAIPFDHSTRHVAVEVEVNGRGPYRFQVDTYASIDACIDDDVAEELGLKKVRTVTNSDGRRSRQRDVVVIDELKLGPATFRRMQTLVDDYDWIGGEGGRKVDGLIGFDAFRDLLVTFDYPRSRLVLTRGRLRIVEPGTMPLLLSNGAPDVFLRIGEHKLRFGLDTGSSSFLALRKEDAEDLPLASELRLVGRGRTVYSEFDVFGARLAAPIRFAGHAIEDAHVTFSEGKAGRLVGYGLLRDYAVTFDRKNRLVSFRKPER